MIRITVEIREGTLTHRATLTAPSIERALKSVEGGKPGRRVRLVFPIEPEARVQRSVVLSIIGVDKIAAAENQHVVAADR